MGWFENREGGGGDACGVACAPAAVRAADGDRGVRDGRGGGGPGFGELCGGEDFDDGALVGLGLVWECGEARKAGGGGVEPGSIGLWELGEVNRPPIELDVVYGCRLGDEYDGGEMRRADLMNGLRSRRGAEDLGLAVAEYVDLGSNITMF